VKKCRLPVFEDVYLAARVVDIGCAANRIGA
jgi:hypothetical protein